MVSQPLRRPSGKVLPRSYGENSHVSRHRQQQLRLPWIPASGSWGSYQRKISLAPRLSCAAWLSELQQLPRDGDGDEPEIAEPPAKKKCNESKLAKLLEDEEPDCNSTTSCLSSDIEAEVLLYTSSRPVPLNADPLEWWSGHYSDYPHLAVLARRFLCIPATSVPAERVFSAAGIIVNKLRCSLQHNNVDALIFLQKNRLQSTRSGIAELPALPVTATEEINKEDVLQEELELDSPDLPCLD